MPDSGDHWPSGLKWLMLCRPPLLLPWPLAPLLPLAPFADIFLIPYLSFRLRLPNRKTKKAFRITAGASPVCT